MATHSAEIRPVIVRSLEPIDLESWLYRYARAIVDAKGTGPAPPTGPQLVTTVTPGTASTEAA